MSNKANFLPNSLWVFYLKYAFRGHWGWLIAYAVFFAGLMSDGILFPNFQRWFIALFEQTPPDGMNLITYATPTIMLIVGLLIMIDGCAALRNWARSRWANRIPNQITEILTDYVHNQSMTFWTGRMPGKVHSQINYVATGVRVIENLLEILFSALIIIINVGLILQINAYVALIFAAVFVFRIVFGLALMRPMSRASKDASSASSSATGKEIDSMSNYSVVKLFAGASKERKYLTAPRQKRVATAIYAQFVQRVFWSVPSFVWDFAFGGTMFLCVWLFMHGHLVVSEIVFTMSVFFSVMGTIGRIINQVPTIVDNISSASRAYTELNVSMDVIDAPNASNLVVTHGKIEFKNVWFKYKRKWVLQDFNLTIQPGERVGLVGASGAGKTTLVNLLMRFYEPSRGEILIDGQNIRDVSQDSLRCAIAFIPQEPTMFNRTIRDNIEYGRPGASLPQIRRAAQRAAADKFIMTTDKKYDSLVGDRGIKLSGGQRQRIAIARAFLKDAPILVLDEATSAMDSETEVAIQKSFEELASGRTTIAIAHRLSTLRNMDKIVVLENGQIVESGTHTSLMRKRGEYARLWKLQSGGFFGD
ncbi:MAG: ABC transporter ATP-binding protein/permease [Muribaculaceae bacterium]|nr:ABC transporter ATP-binding protein/permease [Muribaculaceae bacterium]